MHADSSSVTVRCVRVSDGFCLQRLAKHHHHHRSELSILCIASLEILVERLQPHCSGFNCDCFTNFHARHTHGVVEGLSSYPGSPIIYYLHGTLPSPPSEVSIFCFLFSVSLPGA